jgi:trigger factor
MAGSAIFFSRFFSEQAWLSNSGFIKYRGCKLDYQIETQKNWHTVVTVSVPAENVQPKLDENFKVYQKKANIQGFRKGKVPSQLIRKMFGSQIENDTFQPFIGEAFNKIFKEHEFDNISVPEIGQMNYHPQEGLVFTIEFDVRPDIKVENIEGMTVERERFIIEEKDVQDVLEDIRQRQAMIYDVEGEAQPGHFLSTDLQVVDDSGIPVIGQKYENQSIYLDESNKEITSQLQGVTVGDERIISVKTQKQEPESELIETGKENEPETEQRFKVIVKAIKERRLPELDDEFAKDVGNYESLDALKKEIDENLHQRAKLEQQYAFQEKLVGELISRNTIEVPPSMLDKYLQAVIQDTQKRQKGEVDEDVIREQSRVTAVRQIKWLLLREQIIADEKITVSEEEINALIDQRLETKQLTEEQAAEIKEDKDRYSRYGDEIMQEKVFAFLEEKADIKETEKLWREVHKASGAEHHH